MLEVVRERLARQGALTFVAVYVISAAICCALAANNKAQFTDIYVYRLAGDAVLHRTSLYSVRFAGLPVSYPPFAAIVFTVLAAMPWSLAVVAVTAGSVVTLPLMLYSALRLPPLAAQRDKPAVWRLALAAAALAIWLEPVRTTLGYGQVDLLLAAGVLYDLSLPDDTRHKGAVIGLCAGLKLTPGIFVIYLLLTRRFRAASTAAAVFAATVAAGFALMPSASISFWDVTFLKPGRISPVQNPENQSLLGALSRTLHSPHGAYVWLPVAALVAVIGLTVAVRTQRRGQENQGFAFCAVTGLLISPISWTHHWVLAIPALFLAAESLYSNRESRRPAIAAVGTIAIIAILLIGWLRLARQVPGSDWLHLSGIGLADSEIYVVTGLAVVIAAAVVAFVQLMAVSSRTDVCRQRDEFAQNLMR